MKNQSILSKKDFTNRSSLVMGDFFTLAVILSHQNIYPQFFVKQFSTLHNMACAKYEPKCTWNPPANATRNNTLIPSVDTEYSYNSNASLPCTYRCNNGYEYNNGICTETCCPEGFTKIDGKWCVLQDNRFCAYRYWEYREEASPTHAWICYGQFIAGTAEIHIAYSNSDNSQDLCWWSDSCFGNIGKIEEGNNHMFFWPKTLSLQSNIPISFRKFKKDGSNTTIDRNIPGTAYGYYFWDDTWYNAYWGNRWKVKYRLERYNEDKDRILINWEKVSLATYIEKYIPYANFKNEETISYKSTKNGYILDWELSIDPRVEYCKNPGGGGDSLVHNCQNKDTEKQNCEIWQWTARWTRDDQWCECICPSWTHVSNDNHCECPSGQHWDGSKCVDDYVYDCDGIEVSENYVYHYQCPVGNYECKCYNGTCCCVPYSCTW